MCGIIAVISDQNVTPILLEGLKRLEYRGYDSAGIAVLAPDTHEILRVRKVGKFSQLYEAIHANPHPISGCIGIAHTRWATHGVPSEENAHPLTSSNIVAIVHNGIIENHESLRADLIKKGYQFRSDTDTEVVAHLVHHYLDGRDFREAVQLAVRQLEGAYALAILNCNERGRIIAVRSGSPLVVGLGVNANYVASDSMALLPVTQRFIYLQEGDIADVRQNEVIIHDASGKKIEREVLISAARGVMAADRGSYRHFMAKEIFEQPRAVSDTYEGRLGKKRVLEQAFGANAEKLFDRIKHVQIVACGTSYHAGLVGRYWLESLANIPCQVEIASEIRYRKAVVQPGTLFVTLSQSGETADTLAALRQAKELGYESTLAICNVAESSLVRESNAVFLTHAGPEIGVASTKAFITQLVALFMLTAALGRRHGMSKSTEEQMVSDLLKLPPLLEQVLALDPAIQNLASRFADKRHALFLGRGAQYPIAMEGALKLKEISYIHAEAYPAGELKHGPLALVDKEMPVVVVAPNDELLEKLKSNLTEVRTRGGELIVFADACAHLHNTQGVSVLTMPSVPAGIAPMVYTLPLQLLAYHVAILKGTDVDQPRNLAKSVTVE